MATNAGVYYNDGLAESYNSVLLKNIIRAAKNYPLYHSALGDYSYDQSVNLDLSPSVDLSDGVDVSITPDASVSRDRNANVSSLETEQFTQAMNTWVSGKALVFYANGHGRYHLNLLLMLFVDELTVSRHSFDEVIDNADATCKHDLYKLSDAYQGMCRNFENVGTAEVCADHPSNLAASSGLVNFRNEPTNPCEFVQFRYFMEALVLTEPILASGDDGAVTATFGKQGSTVTIFKAKGTGILLRSPHEIIGYLGRIVKQTFLGADDGLLTITGPDGREAPIFVVKESGSDAEAAIKTKVDGKTYWIPSQSLRSVQSHFSFVALSVLKDIISLNTSTSQLPSSPSRFIIAN